MGKNIKRAYSPRVPAPDDSHWLGEGLQDSLLLDLTAYRYAADSIISRHAAQIGFHYDGLERKPLAAVRVLPDTVPWQLGYLSKWFDNCIISDVPDSLINDLTECFNATVFFAHDLDRIQSQVDLLIHTAECWGDEGMFIEGVREAYSLLVPGGRACFILPTYLNDEAQVDSRYLTVEWGLSKPGPLLRVLAVLEKMSFQEIEIQHVPLKNIGDQLNFGVAEFVKRHREFFGKNARDLVLARLYEDDFQEAIFGGGKRVATILTVIV